MQIEEIILNVQECENTPTPMNILRNLQKLISEAIYIYYQVGIIPNKEEIFFSFTELYFSRREERYLLSCLEETSKEEISEKELFKSLLSLNAQVSTQILTKKPDTIQMYDLAKFYKAI